MPDSPSGKTVRVEHLNQPARHDIPAYIARGVGRFIVTWSHFENHVQQAVWFVLGVSDAAGRLAVREPRITDRLDMIRDLGRLQNKTGDYVLMADMRRRCEVLAQYRHLLAHAMWTKAGDDWVAQLTRGSWNNNEYRDLPDAPKGSKSVTPDSVTITREKLWLWNQQTIELIADLRRIGDKHTEPTSPQKQSAQPHQKTPKKDRG